MTMIEKVAREIHNINVAGNPKITWESMPDSYRELFVKLSRSIIETMLEPTDKMLAVQTMSISYSTDEIWKMFIKAALEEQC